MAVQNFHVMAKIDGRDTVLRGGPRNKDGGMDITVLMRDEGEKVEAVSILCRVFGDDKEGRILQVTVQDTDGMDVHQIRRYR